MHDCIDVHTHIVPENFPPYAGRGRDVPWPSMAPAHACHRHVMISGKVYRTPVVVRAVDDGFIVPMPWGLGTDWYRNVKAAGGCSIRWNGRDYTLVEPEVINDAASVAPAFSKSQRAAMRRFGIEYALHLRQRSQAA